MSPRYFFSSHARAVLKGLGNHSGALISFMVSPQFCIRTRLAVQKCRDIFVDDGVIRDVGLPCWRELLATSVDDIAFANIAGSADDDVVVAAVQIRIGSAAVKDDVLRSVCLGVYSCRLAHGRKEEVVLEKPGCSALVAKTTCFSLIVPRSVSTQAHG